MVCTVTEAWKVSTGCSLKGGSEILFISQEIANLLGLILLSQICKFPRCASLLIENPQFFMINQ